MYTLKIYSFDKNVEFAARIDDSMFLALLLTNPYSHAITIIL